MKIKCTTASHSGHDPRTVYHITGKLPTGCINIVTACFANGGSDTRFAQNPCEGLYPVWLRAL
jgi:hypothetical protein